MVYVRNIVQAVRNRCFHYHKSAAPTFGIMFDIDGVIMRGARVLPQAQRAFKLLTDENGFRVPTVKFSTYYAIFKKSMHEYNIVSSGVPGSKLAVPIRFQ